MINIASEFTGAKAFKQAEKSTFNLEKNVKKLGKSLGLALSVSAVVAFGKASAKAFMDDQKSATKLANTLNNLGLAFQTVGVENFISQLSRTAAVADDVLRPAMEKLLTTTGSVAKSQELLQQAISISRGSGIDLETVINDLTKAYTGQTRGLEKYKLSLSRAELQAMSFEDVMIALNKQFKGSNAAYMTTYAYKMEVLTVAAGEAKETIGKGLVDALLILSGNTTVEGLAEDMQKLADATAWYLKQFAQHLKPYVDQIKNIIDGIRVVIDFFATNQTGASFGQSAADQFKKGLEEQRALAPKAGNNAVTGYKKTAAQIKAEQDAIKLSKANIAATKANTAEIKRQAIAKKQNALFDLDIIQRMAALQGKITDEEKLRLNLQLALLTGNEAQAAKLAGELADSIDKTGQLKKWLNELPDANNPFKGWDEWLKNFKANLATVTAVAPSGAPAMNGSGLDFGGNRIGSLVPNFTAPPLGTYGQPTQVNLNLDGKQVASVLLDQSMSGSQSYINRRTGGFE
jgi:hypothetical protein